MHSIFQSRLRFVGLAVFFLSWLNANHYRPWTSFHSEALCFLGIGILCASQFINKTAISVPRITGWIAFAGLLSWLQYVFGLVPFAGDVLIASTYLAALLMSIIFGYQLLNRSDIDSASIKINLAHAVWGAALISAAIGLVQWVNLADQLGIYGVQTEIGGRAAGNLAQPNQLATFLLMGMAALVYVYENKVIGKTGLTAAVTFLTAALVLTQSRAGMVSVIVIATFVLWKQRSCNLRLPRQAVLWWVGGFACGTLSLSSVNEFLLLSDSRNLTAIGSISERWLIWKQVAYAIGQSPWLGYGWNQTPTANAIGALAFPGATTYTNAHNILLDLMVWCGIPLGLLISGMIAYWFVSRMWSVKQRDAILAMAAMLPIAVHSLLEFPFAYSYFLISAGLLIGIVEAAHVPVRVVWVKVQWMWLLLSVWAGLSAYMAYEYFRIEEDFRIVRFESMHVGVTPFSYKEPHVWMLSNMAAMLQAARQVPKPDMSPGELDNLRKVSDRFAYGAIRFKYVQALGLNGDPAGATKQLQIIHGMYGDFFFNSCKEEMLLLIDSKYPQLASVRIPD